VSALRKAPAVDVDDDLSRETMTAYFFARISAKTAMRPA
jgi:hypothetical protein